MEVRLSLPYGQRDKIDRLKLALFDVSEIIDARSLRLDNANFAS